jgi:NitT/TauT family transport system substrate-binding protein
MDDHERVMARRISRRRLMKGVSHVARGALTVAVSARFLGLSPAVAKVPEKIVIGQLPFNTEVTLYAGGHDFFAEQGLTIEYLKGVGGPAVIQALASGSIPAGDIGVGPALVAAARGLPLVSPALGGISAPKHPWDRIMVRRDSPIRTVADLRGKRLALHQRGTMEDLCLNALKKTHGIGPQDLEIALIPAPNQPQVLDARQVDAIYAIPPFDTIAEQEFNARTLINTTEFVPYIGYGTFSFRQDFVETYPDAAKGLMKAWIQMCRWIDDNAGKANGVAGKALGIKEALWPKLRLPYFVRNGLPVLPNVWHVYYLLVAGKVLDPVDDPAKLIANSVVEPTRRIALSALHELGIAPDPVVNDMREAQYPLLPKPAEAYHADWEKS